MDYLNSAKNRAFADTAGAQLRPGLGVRNLLSDPECPSTWGNLSFNRTDGCAEITINRHLTGEDAKDLEQVLRSFFDALEERRNIEKEAAYRQQVQAQEVAMRELMKQRSA